MTNTSTQTIDQISIPIPGFGNIFLKQGYSLHTEWYKAAERQSKAWWAANVKEDWNILDIGANVGMYSVLFSKLVPKGKVFCFEPTPTVEILKKNLEHIAAPNCEVLEYAVGNRCGVIDESIQMIWKRELLERPFNFITVDEFVKMRSPLQIDAIKIDTDGYDPEVLYGCVETLKSQTPILIVELNHEALGYRGHTAQQAIDFMNNLGYKVDQILDHENYLFRK